MFFKFKHIKTDLTQISKGLNKWIFRKQISFVTLLFLLIPKVFHIFFFSIQNKCIKSVRVPAMSVKMHFPSNESLSEPWMFRFFHYLSKPMLLCFQFGIGWRGQIRHFKRFFKCWFWLWKFEFINLLFHRFNGNFRGGKSLFDWIGVFQKCFWPVSQRCYLFMQFIELTIMNFSWGLLGKDSKLTGIYKEEAHEGIESTNGFRDGGHFLEKGLHWSFKVLGAQYGAINFGCVISDLW